MSNYWQKLQDPKWQKLRLKAMEQNDFRCEVCMDSQSTLNVHHNEYFKGRDPWDYDVSQLTVICQSCHERFHDTVDLYKLIGSFARLNGPDSREELGFVLAGYAGYDYEKILNCLEQEPKMYTHLLYQAGLKAKRLYERSFNKCLKEKKDAKQTN